MLSSCLVQEVQRLLAAGHSRRQVGRMTGVSRLTVNQIAADRRPDYAEPSETPLSSIRRRKPKRCGTCGGLVYPPCQLCRLRAKLAQRANRATRRNATDRPPKRAKVRNGNKRNRET